MNLKRLNRFWLYVILLGLSILFLFPFYWVIISSLKSIEGLSMNPPSYYPSEFRKQSVVFEAKNKIAEVGESQWFKLVDSEDLFNKKDQKAGQSPQGAYYLRLDAGKPTQLVSWFPDSSVTAAQVPDSMKVRFSNLRVNRLDETGGTAVVFAKMVRQNGGSYNELLFSSAEGKTFSPSIQILENVKHSDIRDFHIRPENYPETLRGPEASYGQSGAAGFLLFMRNSFFISIMSVIGQVLSSSLVAFAFARLQFKGRNVLFALLLATMMIPGAVTMIPMFGIYKTIGWVNSFLPLIVPQFTAGAFNVFLLRQYMLTLPKELDDSAAIDGCGPFRTYWHIVLPNSIPVLIVVGLFTFVGSWQDVMGPLIYLDDASLRTVTLGLEYFRSPFVDTRHLIMTGAVLAMLPVALLFVFFQRYIMSGIATTGLK
jgi:ABC-type glycerol-3-phosphate transport system permease component